MESKYLEFREISKLDKKTKYIQVISKLHGFILGEIRWYGAWRQYVFYPAHDTLYNRTCLSEMSEYLNSLMNERKTGA
jgi:hypothetical protein